MSHHDDAVHPASVIHLQQARQSGQVAKSQELSASLQLVFSIAACWFLFSMIGQRLQDFASETWSSQRLGSEYNSTVFNEDVRQGIIAAGSGILPLLGIIMVVGILSHYLQTGPMWVAKSAVPDPNRLSPMHWWKQLFSLRGARLSRFPRPLFRSIACCPKGLHALSLSGGPWPVHHTLGRSEYFGGESLAGSVENH